MNTMEGAPLQNFDRRRLSYGGRSAADTPVAVLHSFSNSDKQNSIYPHRNTANAAGYLWNLRATTAYASSRNKGALKARGTPVAQPLSRPCYFGALLYLGVVGPAVSVEVSLLCEGLAATLRVASVRPDKIPVTPPAMCPFVALHLVFPVEHLVAHAAPITAKAQKGRTIQITMYARPVRGKDTEGSAPGMAGGGVGDVMKSAMSRDKRYDA